MVDENPEKTPTENTPAEKGGLSWVDKALAPIKPVLGWLEALFRPLVRPAQDAWSVIVAELDAVRGAPLVVIPLIVCAALMSQEQGADLTVTAGSDTCKASWLVLATAFYGFQCWFWARLVVDRGGKAREQTLPTWAVTLGERLRDWTPRVLGAAPFFIAFMASLKAKVDLVLLPWAFLVMGLVAPFVFRARKPVANHLGLEAGPPFFRAVQWGTLFLGLGSLIVLCIWPVGPAQFLGAIGVVFMGLAFITAALAATAHFGRHVRLPVLATVLLLAVFVFGRWNDNHEVGRRTLHRADAPKVMDLPNPRKTETVETRLVAWCAAQPGGCLDDKNPTPIVFIAAEGGASRAGYWAADVLGRLQFDTKDDERPFSDRVFAISSVSGGSVGVMAYVSTLSDRPDLAGAPFADGLADLAGVDYLSPAMSGLLFPDLVQRFSPWPLAFLPDRAETLETGFESGWRQHCRHEHDNDPDHVTCHDRDLWTKPFLSLWRPADGGGAKRWTPIVLINGARQEDGRRIITTNVAITPEDFPNAIDFHDLTGRDVRISTAIHNGARFPVVSPGGTLKDRDGKPYGHVLDGGYFDGGGVVTMADTAAAALRVAKDHRFHLKPVFVELNNDNDDDDTAASLIRAGDKTVCKAQASAEPQSPKPPGSRLKWPWKKTAESPDRCDGGYPLHKLKDSDLEAGLPGPLQGLASARGAHGVAAALALAQAVEHSVGATGQGEWGRSPSYHLVHLCKTKDVKLPMDWALSKSAMRRTDKILGIDIAPQSGASAGAPTAATIDVVSEDETRKDERARRDCQVSDSLAGILIAAGAKVGPDVQTRRVPVEAKHALLWGLLGAAAFLALVGAIGSFWSDRGLDKAGLTTTVGLQRLTSVEDFKKALAEWRAAFETQPELERYWKLAFGFDAPLIVGYWGVVTLLAELLFQHQPRYENQAPVHGYLTGFFITAFGLVTAAALADVVEDLVQIRMIRTEVSAGRVQAAHWATVAKWSFLALSLIVLVVGAVLGCERGG